MHVLECFYSVQASFFSLCHLFIFISPLFNQLGQLRTSSHLQLRPGQDKAKRCDKNNNTELHGINKHTVNNTIENRYTVCANEVRR